MSKSKKSSTAELETQSAETQVTETVLQDNLSQETEEQKNENTLVMTQADGQEYSFDFELEYTEKADYNDMAFISANIADMIKAYNGVTKGYFTLVSKLAILIGDGKYKSIQGIKTPNELLIRCIGVSKSTASEMVKVAKRFYTNLGNLTNPELGIFTYSELVKLATYDDETIEGVILGVQEIGEKHTRADVQRVVSKIAREKLGFKQDSKTTTPDSTESKTTTPDSTESKTTTPDSTESKTTTPDSSESKTKTQGTEPLNTTTTSTVSKQETPFAVDFQKRYIDMSNRLTELTDTIEMLDIDTIKSTLNEIVLEMLQDISNLTE